MSIFFYSLITVVGLTCLHRGPVALIDRQSLPVALEPIVAPDLWSYQPARVGVVIPSNERDRGHIALQQRQLLDLFVPVKQREMVTEPNAQIGKQQEADSTYASDPAGSSHVAAALENTAALEVPVPDQRYKEKLQQCEQELFRATEREYPLSDPTVKKLQRLQQDLGLTDADLAPLEILATCQLKAIPPPQLINQSLGAQNSVSAHSRSRLLPRIGIATTVLALAGAISGLHQRLDWQMSQRLKAIEALAQASKDHECLTQAQIIPQSSTHYATAQRLLKQCEARFHWQRVQVKTLAGHSDSVFFVTVSPDGQTLASGSEDKTIKLWQLNSEKLLRTLSGHSGSVRSIAISPDGQTLASGSEDKTIKLWQLGSGKLLRTLSGHSDPVWSVAISPDGQTLASGSGDKTIKLWQLGNGKLLRTLSGHSDSVRSIAISPDGQAIASGSWDKTIKFWQLQTGELLQTFSGHTDRVTSVAIGPDSQTLTSGSRDKTVKLWHLGSGKLLRTLSGHSDWVISVAISPRPTGAGPAQQPLWSGPATGSLAEPDLRSYHETLISSSKDKTIKLWWR